MAGKCPMCGAPMEGDRYGYCGYIEKKAEEPYANANRESQQQPVYQQSVQPQITINAQAINNARFTPGVSRKSKTVALLLCIFLGYFGAHKFWARQVWDSFIYLRLGFSGLAG